MNLGTLYVTYEEPQDFARIGRVLVVDSLRLTEIA